MLVDVERGQRADIHFEFVVGSYRVGQLVVESVDALDDEDLVAPDLQRVAVELGAPGFEIESPTPPKLPVVVSLRSRM